VNDKKIDDVDEAYYDKLAGEFSADDYALPAGTVVTRGEGDEPGRAVLADYLTPEELETVSRRGRGRPGLSPGTRGRSPKLQVTVPPEIDAALDLRAAAEGRKVPDLVRDAITQYLAAG